MRTCVNSASTHGFTATPAVGTVPMGPNIGRGDVCAECRDRYNHPDYREGFQTVSTIPVWTGD